MILPKVLTVTSDKTIDDSFIYVAYDLANKFVYAFNSIPGVESGIYGCENTKGGYSSVLPFDITNYNTIISSTDYVDIYIKTEGCESSYHIMFYMYNSTAYTWNIFFKNKSGNIVGNVHHKTYNINTSDYFAKYLLCDFPISYLKTDNVFAFSIHDSNYSESNYLNYRILQCLICKRSDGKIFYKTPYEGYTYRYYDDSSNTYVSNNLTTSDNSNLRAYQCKIENVYLGNAIEGNNVSDNAVIDLVKITKGSYTIEDRGIFNNCIVNADNMGYYYIMTLSVNTSLGIKIG